MFLFFQDISQARAWWDGLDNDQLWWWSMRPMEKHLWRSFLFYNSRKKRIFFNRYFYSYWPNGVLPYSIKRDMTDKQRLVLAKAFGGCFGTTWDRTERYSEKLWSKYCSRVISRCPYERLMLFLIVPVVNVKTSSILDQRTSWTTVASASSPMTRISTGSITPSPDTHTPAGVDWGILAGTVRFSWQILAL